jgi:Histone chaperone Rttp106-like
LFFLATGIFFGFKKPLAFFPFEIINSISYTSVLQRTFNLNIAVQLPTQDEIKDHEFSMIDQADFCGIDAYIKRHELQDSSLADSRKAKKLNLNGTKKGGDEGEAEEGEQPGELQKAQQNIEEAEDEEEEDYDPGSEGSSDGSGESSEQESENVNGGGDDGDVVAEELGSEAEEVMPDSVDEDQL